MYRFMRIIIFFDLPSLTVVDRREYTKFRKHLIHEGFIMVQESIYSKLVLNTVAAKGVQKKKRDNKPKKGLVQMLTITEKQYANIEYVIGNGQTKVIDNDSRFIIL